MVAKNIMNINIVGYSEDYIPRILDNFPEVVAPHIIVNIHFANVISEINKHGYHWTYLSDYKLSETDEFILGVLRPRVKKIVVNDFINKFPHQSYLNKFKPCIHHSCVISRSARVGFGVVMEPCVIISSYAEINDFCNINRNVSIGHHTKIGAYTMINPGVNIAGRCVIGESVEIGIGATILDNISIGDNSVIGAGSVVTKSVPSGVVAYGSPCKIIRSVSSLIGEK